LLSIVKRNSVYYFRLRVPADMRKHFPCNEIRCSLHTQLYRQAKSLARGKLGELERVFMTIRSGVLTDDEITKLVDKYKRENLAKSDEWIDTVQANGSGDIKDARLLLSEIYSDKMDELTNVLLNERGMETLTVHTAHSLLNEQGQDGVNIASYSPEFKSLCRAVALANKEIYDTVIQRNDTGDSDYDRQERSKPKSKTLKELIEEFHAEKERGWADPASTKAIHKRILHMFGNIRLDEIDRKMCVAFRDDLKQYPLKNSDYETPWRDLAKMKKSRMSERTQNGTVSELITLFTHANNNALGIRGNPAMGLLLSKNDCTPVKVREPYSVDELNRMLLVLAKVDKSKKPETFWIPLLLLYTGARANEICMLRCDDVALGFIHFRNRAEHGQKTKNKKDRQAPIHSHLLKMGFAEYCDSQRLVGQDRLFSNLRIQRGKWNVAYGKQFERTFKNKFLPGYTKEQLTAKDLHTFRMTFISWFIKSGLVSTARDITTLQSIVGHCEADELKFMLEFMQKTKLTVEGYGGGLDVDQAAFMEQLDYGIDLKLLGTGSD